MKLPSALPRLLVAGAIASAAVAGSAIAVVLPAGASSAEEAPFPATADLFSVTPGAITPAPGPAPATGLATPAATPTPSATSTASATGATALPQAPAPTVTKAVRKATAQSAQVKRPTAVKRHTGWTGLNRAIDAIPGYRQARPAKWVVTSKYGHYGMTDWYNNTIYISPTVPASRLRDVALHEWAHIQTARAYGGNIPAMIAGLNRVYGGGGRGNLNGAERAADCMAAVSGAKWTHYTSCTKSSWRSAARTLLAGRQL